MDILKDANEILIDFSGNVNYLTDDKLYIYDNTDTEVVGGLIKTGSSDMAEPTIDKLINFIDCDYVGSFKIVFTFDDIYIHTIELPYSSTRTTRWVSFPLSKRKALQKIQLAITSSVKDTIIYRIEVDFTVLKRRRYN